MSNDLTNGIDHRKMKIFLLLLLCSSLIWFISKLSDTYVSQVPFNLDFVAMPDSLQLVDASRRAANLTIGGSGFLLLRYHLVPQTIKLDLSGTALQNNGNSYALPLELFRTQLEKQLWVNATLIDWDTEPIYLEMDKIEVSKVPIMLRVQVNLAQDHFLETPLEIFPDSIVVKGPKNEIDNVTAVYSEKKVLAVQATDFSIHLKLEKPKDLKNTTYSESSVRVHGKISKFSEQIVTVPVTVINLPEGMEIKIFPEEVAVVCKGKLQDLKTLHPDSFKVVADFGKVNEEKSRLLVLELVERPSKLLDASLVEVNVEFILKRTP